MCWIYFDLDFFLSHSLCIFKFTFSYLFFAAYRHCIQKHAAIIQTKKNETAKKRMKGKQNLRNWSEPIYFVQSSNILWTEIEVNFVLVQNWSLLVLFYLMPKVNLNIHCIKEFFPTLIIGNELNIWSFWIEMDHKTFDHCSILNS